MAKTPIPSVKPIKLHPKWSPLSSGDQLLSVTAHWRTAASPIARICHNKHLPESSHTPSSPTWSSPQCQSASKHRCAINDALCCAFIGIVTALIYVQLYSFYLFLDLLQVQLFCSLCLLRFLWWLVMCPLFYKGAMSKHRPHAEPPIPTLVIIDCSA